MIVALEGRYRWIRPLAEADVPTLKAWEQDPEIAYFCGRKFPDGEEAGGWWQALQRDRHRTGFAIVSQDGALIGDLELEHIAWRAGRAEIRISIGDKRYWDRGIGTAALREGLEVAFAELACERVYLRVTEDNARALHVYRKLGFRKTGVLPPSDRLPGSPSLFLMEIDRARYYGKSCNADSAASGSTAAR